MTKRKPMKISYAALGQSLSKNNEQTSFVLKPPELLKGVVPADAKMAMDYSITNVYDYANAIGIQNGFIGYPQLAELALISEFRSPSETVAKEMTREWIKLKSEGEGDLSEKIAEIEAEFKRHKIQDLFRLATLHDGYYGRGQIFIDIKGHDDLTLPLVIDKATIKKNSLNGFRNIEPIWTTPSDYNSTKPWLKDFYKPHRWYVMGETIHASRLETFISRPVPDMLKPAFNFSGISLSQLMLPYVDHWISTRDSVSNLLHSFSITALKTNMESILGGGMDQALFDRIQLFVNTRDNRGLMAIDKEMEELIQLNTPLSGLAELLSKSQEQMSAPAHVPLVILLGITPGGLNASSREELIVWYDNVAAMQEALFTDPLEKILKIIQLDLYGVIDDSITFEYEPLERMDGEALSRIRKSDSDAGIAYINAGVISPEEERARLAADVNSGYNSLDPEDMPELPEDQIQNETNGPDNSADQA